jgi:predicted lipid-binding transport protein (Tim44 family)
MVFIPIVAHEAKPPSARALDLARRLREQIDLFERQYPGTSREDLRAAAAIAIGEGASRPLARKRAVAAMLGVVAAILGAGLVVQSSTGQTGAKTGWPMIAVAIATAAVAVAAAAIRRSRR